MYVCFIDSTVLFSGAASLGLACFLLWRASLHHRKSSTTQKPPETTEEPGLSDDRQYEKVFGDFILLKDLGRGRMGVVRLALRKGSSAPDGLVAIKTILLPSEPEESPAEGEGDLTESESLVARFRREAKILTKSHHPNILEIYEWGKQGEEHYIVTEYIEGYSFREYMNERGRLSLEEVCRFFSQTASALQYLHDRKAFHRDLKPENILRSPDGEAKLIDFGLATAPEQSREITLDGVIQGTLLYMDPEHLNGRKQDAYYDQFSLGTILFEMLAGRGPLDKPPDNSRPAQMLAHYESPRHPLSKYRADLSQEVTAVIDRMLELDSKRRYESVQAAFLAFEQACKF